MFLYKFAKRNSVDFKLVRGSVLGEAAMKKAGDFILTSGEFPVRLFVF
jgi:hypothetical protein